MGKILKEIDKIKKDLEKFRPSSAPGILTSQTTGGITRSPIKKGGKAISTAGQGLPRWL